MSEDNQTPTAQPVPDAPSRGAVYGQAGRWIASWSVRFVAIAAALWIMGWIIGQIWTVLLPMLLALLLCTVLWPPVRWMRARGLPPALATSLTLLLSVGILVAVISAIAPSISNQAYQLGNEAVRGVTQVQKWLQGPPLNLQDQQINTFINSITGRLQDSAESIATGVFTGVSAAGSAIVALVTAVMLTFFFLKDGDKFLPWIQRHSGLPLAAHLGELCERIWTTLGGFIRTQALVSLIDAFFIGLGLVILDVPLAYALAVVTFFAGFIPIVGAFVAGALAVLIALVSNGFVTALIVLGIVVAVQQLEGNVLSPMLQSKSMNLHPVVVLIAIAYGGTAFGIIGAFLAVPVAAAVAVLMRYLGELMDQRTGEGVLTPPKKEKPAKPKRVARLLRRGKVAAAAQAAAPSETPEPTTETSEPTTPTAPPHTSPSTGG